MIPKIIHYCWFGKNKYNILHKNCLSTWRKHLQDYKFICWTERNTPIMNLPIIKYYYNKKKWAFVSDYVRLYVLYNYGGIYLDTDIEIIKNLDPLLCNKVFLGEERENRITLGIFGGQKGHIFFKKGMDLMINRFNSNKAYLIAPEIAEKVYYFLNDEVKKEITIYPYEFFYPYNPNVKGREILFYKNIKENTFAIHHWNHSWKMNFFEKFNRFLKRKIYG